MQARTRESHARLLKFIMRLESAELNPLVLESKANSFLERLAHQLPREFKKAIPTVNILLL
jgi:hypothetical protein